MNVRGGGDDGGGEQPGVDAATADGARPIDLVLGQGSAEELAVVRNQLARDPLAALEFAETRQLVETMRELRIRPSRGHLLALAALVRRAHRRPVRRRRRTPWPVTLLQFVAAAAIVFGGLAVVDPLRLRSSARPPVADTPRVANAPPRMQIVAPPPAARLRRPEALAAIRAAAARLGGSGRLPAALQRFQELSQPERLACWVRADNRLAAQREGFERRASSEERRRMLDSRNAAAIDERVQALAAGLLGELREPTSLPLPDVALAVRAVLASGRVRADDEVVHGAAERLAAALPLFHGGELATALAALGDVAAASGGYVDELQENGERLLREVLETDVDTWTRRLPTVLTPATPVAQVADAGRFLAIGPAFGIDAEAALLVRMLLAASLQERRELRSDTPEVLAALVYGFGDALPRAERRELEEKLCTWRPASLVPDYVTLLQLAWSMTPASAGYAEFRRESGSIDTLPTPATVRERAAFCLCLSAPFALPPARSGERAGD